MALTDPKKIRGDITNYQNKLLRLMAAYDANPTDEVATSINSLTLRNHINHYLTMTNEKHCVYQSELKSAQNRLTMHVQRLLNKEYEAHFLAQAEYIINAPKQVSE